MNYFIKYLIGIIFIIGFIGCSKINRTIWGGQNIQNTMCEQGYDNCRTLRNGDKYCKDKWCR